MRNRILWRPLDPDHVRDPYPMYERLRLEDPVHLAQTGEHIVSGYSDVKSILRSPDFRSGNRLDWLSKGIRYLKNHDQDLAHIYQAINTFLLFLNPPDHGPIRALVAKTWDKRDLEPTIRTLAKARLSGLRGDFDLVADYAQPLPGTVISHLLGIPGDEYGHLQRLGSTMTKALDLYVSWRDLVELDSASKSLVEFFRKLIDRKRQRPADDLASRLVRANADERLLRDEQMISLLLFLFLAGEETSSHSIATSLSHVIRIPDVYSRLKSKRLDAAIVTDELFRFDSPVQLLGRIASKEVEIGGRVIPAGGAVTLVIASANRDGAVFDHPERLVPDRTPNPHLAFGYGTHYCLGEWLGKLQTRIAIECFIDKFGSASMPDQEIEWNKNLSVRGMNSLMIRTTE